MLTLLLRCSHYARHPIVLPGAELAHRRALPLHTFPPKLHPMTFTAGFVLFCLAQGHVWALSGCRNMSSSPAPTGCWNEKTRGGKKG